MVGSIGARFSIRNKGNIVKPDVYDICHSKWMKAAGQLDSYLMPDAHFICLTDLYLYASYLYYQRDMSIMADHSFDALCKHLYKNYNKLKPAGVWWVGKVILKKNLRQGTFLLAKYPEFIQVTAETMILRNKIVEYSIYLNKR